VAEGLRKVAELPPGRGVVFFGEQADVVSEREQAREERSPFVEATREGVVGGEPEAAGEEGALSLGKPVDGVRVVGGRVAVDEAVAAELALDRRHGSAHALVARREKADEGE
jgi:hypothetical protein